MIILKVTKNQVFTISLEDILFEKPRGRGRGEGSKTEPPSLLRVKDSSHNISCRAGVHFFSLMLNWELSFFLVCVYSVDFFESNFLTYFLICHKNMRSLINFVQL